jgi:hypothetical protein
VLVAEWKLVLHARVVEGAEEDHQMAALVEAEEAAPHLIVKVEVEVEVDRSKEAP